MKRRKFLKLSAPLSISPLVLNGIPLNSFATPGMIAMNCEEVNDRVLVIIQLSGGNDGLNMIVPLEQYDTYASIRPTIRLTESDLINLDSTLPGEDQVYIHPALTGIKSLYEDGKANIIQAAGYTDQNKSHFKATDLWLSGGDSGAENFNLDTGWMGRYLSSRFPGQAGNPTPLNPDPLGIQLGDSKPSLGFHSDEEHSTAINLSGQDPSGFYTLISEIGGLPIPVIPDSEYGDELEFIMNVESSVSNYAARISSVFDAGTNMVTYPDYNLADQLKTVARLLSGGSQTKVFLVKLGGFDTHVNQVESDATATGNHASLLNKLSLSIQAFQDDLDALNLADQVMTVSFSEFGRKAEENGGFGTDHGNMAPMFVFGNGVEAGVTGTNVDLSNLAGGQLQNHQHDYRQVFTTLLQDWMGADEAIMTDTMFESYLDDKLPFINSASIVDPSCYGGPLPVELSFFKARLTENKMVVLSWDTASEVNSDYFDIERSEDGKNFDSILRSPAKGTSSLVNHYKEVDEEPLSGLSYYRLKQVDKDGQFEYSKLEVVELKVPLISNLRLYPNPAVYNFNLAFMSEQSGTIQIRILNTNGSLLRQRTLSVNNGFNKFSFPVDRLPLGTYVVEMISPELGIKEQHTFIKS